MPDASAHSPDETPLCCPYCGSEARQSKAGLNRSGTHRCRCGVCARHYTPRPRAHGYGDDIRRQALEAHAAGVSLRRIARLLGVNHQSVVNWTRQQSPPSPAAEEASAAPATAPGRSIPSPSEPPPPLPPAAPAAPPLTAGKQRATIEDVAQRAGVAASTVSNYLNDKGRMSAATRERIREAIDDLHFTPNALVRAIRAKRTRILGVLIFDLNRIDERVDHALTIPLLAGIYDAADAAGHDILLYTGWPKRPERHSGMDFLNGHVDGLLWAVPGIGAPALARVAAADLPVVAMLSRHVPANVGYVNGENAGAVREIVRHLATRGHRRIAFAGPDRLSSNYEDRRAGYRQGLDDAGIPFDPALAAAAPDTRRVEGTAQNLLAEWLRLPSPPTAVVAVTDEWAEAVGIAAHQAGLRIPDDLAVTGFDDVPAARSVFGGLTTVHQPFRQIGSLAVERLVRLIDGAPVDACRLDLPLELIERASTRAG